MTRKRWSVASSFLTTRTYLCICCYCQACSSSANSDLTSLLQRWACFFGHYWWQRFPLPTFLGEYLYDSANLGEMDS